LKEKQERVGGKKKKKEGKLLVGQDLDMKKVVLDVNVFLLIRGVYWGVFLIFNLLEKVDQCMESFYNWVDFVLVVRVIFRPIKSIRTH